MFARILEHAQNPQELEKLYRQNPEEFEKAFRKVDLKKMGPAYEFWAARIEFAEPEVAISNNELPHSHFLQTPLWVTILLGLLAGTIAKIPFFFTEIEQDFFYQRFLSFSIFPILALYFLIAKRAKPPTIGVVTVCVILALLPAAFMPDINESDSSMLALMHLPLLLWSITGIAFVGDRFKDFSARISYLKFNGELLIYTVITLLGGIVLSALTLGLFSTIKVDITKWYFEWITVYGAAASPVVAAYMVQVQSRGKTLIAPLVSRIFSPLFLITLVVYLVTVMFQSTNLFLDRNYLLVFNIMMFIVLGISVFSITEKQIEKGQRWLDMVILSLLACGVIVNVIALSAILFRLSSYGLTPNRVAVLGTNIVVFGHMSGLFFSFFRYFQGKTKIEFVKKWIAGYLPIYVLWTAFMVFLFPFLYQFK
jgi:hypothetical protein